MEADFAVATTSLSRGDKARAKQLFTRCIERGDPIMFYYIWNSASELEGLKR
jgi:hypothetical protein